MLNGNVGEAHNTEYFDIPQKSDMTCGRYFEDDAKLPLYRTRLETMPDDDSKEGECLRCARR